MLLAFYKSLLGAMQDEFSELTDENFGINSPKDIFPYFTVAGKTFTLKNPQLKKSSSDVKDFNNSETFFIQSSKKTFELQRTPIVVEDVEIKSKGAIFQLTGDDYSIKGKEIELKKNYDDGDELIVVYFSKGAEYADRFYQEFSVIIYDTNKAKLDHYSSLSLPFIWSFMKDMQDERYLFESDNIQAVFSPSSLTFKNACSDSENDITFVSLDFIVNGQVTFYKEC